MSKRIAIFASGSGSNAENIYHFFKRNPQVEVVLIITNNSTAKVIERANRLKIPCKVIDKEIFYNSNQVVEWIKADAVDLIVLAGFLWLIPSYLIAAFPNKIINIHPALLPKYGGKGMYGNKVHEAVIVNREKESGITIHYVNEKYDEGNIIFQAKCEITLNDNSETLANKIHELEYKHFPQVIESLLL
ncbi:MAG: phosphoribosylglycinamide formyltransferase [Flavobacteriales bacterium]|nr:phosphoribosylglycinamide formyltransferase [Flavobacteriales bacterium]